MRFVQVVRSHTRPWRNSSFESRCRVRIRSTRTCSRARAKSRAASNVAVGTATAVSAPAMTWRSRMLGVLRSDLSRSPAGRGVFDGAIT